MRAKIIIVTIALAATPLALSGCPREEEPPPAPEPPAPEQQPDPLPEPEEPPPGAADDPTPPGDNDTGDSMKTDDPDGSSDEEAPGYAGGVSGNKIDLIAEQLDLLKPTDLDAAAQDVEEKAAELRDVIHSMNEMIRAAMEMQRRLLEAEFITGERSERQENGSRSEGHNTEYSDRTDTPSGSVPSTPG